MEADCVDVLPVDDVHHVGHVEPSVAVVVGAQVGTCKSSVELPGRSNTVLMFPVCVNQFVKIMVLATLGASFFFLFASAILVLGVGTSVSQIACEVGIWWCILLYATSKVLIYVS